MRLLLLVPLGLLLGCGDRAPAPAAPALPEAYDDAGFRPREGDQDCSDFDTHEEAQRYFDTRVGVNRDFHDLDPDGDGIACEELL